MAGHTAAPDWLGSGSGWLGFGSAQTGLGLGLDGSGASDLDLMARTERGKGDGASHRKRVDAAALDSAEDVQVALMVPGDEEGYNEATDDTAKKMEPVASFCS